MRLTPRQYAEALFQATDKAKPAELPAIFARLRARLRQARALKLFPRIAAAFEALQEAKTGRRRVLVATARPHGAETVKKQLEANLGSVAVETKLDPDLRGGAVLTIGDTRIDGSIAAALRRLRARLAQSPTMTSHPRTNAPV